jgi:hypothetical protein
MTVVNNSTSIILEDMTLNRTAVTDIVWSTQLSTKTTPGTLAPAITQIAADAAFIKQIEGGRWKIEANQMIFYASDNVTEVARFNLFDEAGALTMISPYDRRRV